MPEKPHIEQEPESEHSEKSAHSDADRGTGEKPQTATRATQLKKGSAIDQIAEMPTEHGGQKGPEPTRYGDWEKNGRCTDF